MPFTPVQLPSGRWQGGFRHPVTRRKVTRTFDYCYEAESWALLAEQKAQADLEPQPIPDPTAETTVEPGAGEWSIAGPSTGLTVAEFGHSYLERRRGLLAASTLNWYTSQLRGLAVTVHPKRKPLAEADMARLKRAEVEQWITDSIAAGVGRPTINARLKALRTLYRDALAEGELTIPRDPTHGIKYLTTDVEVDHVVAAGAEESALLLAAPEQLRAAALVALDAGLRWQEAYALTAANVVGDYLIVTQVIERRRGSGERIRKYPKGHRSRVVPMTERLTAALAPYVAAAENRPGCERGEGLLFPALGRADRPSIADENKPWDYHNHRRRQWAPTLAAVGAARVDGNRIKPDFGFHSLRHTYGSRLSAAGVPRPEIAVLMGHADESTTARYIHAGDDGRRRDLVRQALGGTRSSRAKLAGS